MVNVPSQDIFVSETLYAHNKLRKLHGVPSLEHDEELSKSAVEWALKLASNKKLAYKRARYNNSNEEIGENILKADKPYLSGNNL